ncbi:MAG TPA: GNAT family N-acetyltransferase [Streptosporangiaceae bacterium]|nr:GNAT family N-acetyltransferase [Streptosporangiaceae bacterium]
MDELALRPMTAAEFQPYRARLVPEYAAEHVRAGHWTADQAETLAARQVDDLLPEGPASPGMLMLMASTADGEPVGLVWVALDRPRPGEAWIYDIEVSAGQRGKGYGRALLQAAEREAAKHGSTAVGLNVFGTNAVARRLYESSGYQITAMNMRKELGAS